MGNAVSLPNVYNKVVESIHMSNGLTAVFIEVLVISGSMLATTVREKELVIWFAEKDQSSAGRGTVGFDVDDIPWTVDGFQYEKQFILHMISNAVAEMGWEKFDYTPNKDIVTSCLKQFAQMIEMFEQQHVDIDNYIEWRDCELLDGEPGIPIGYPKCQKHDIYLTCFGCLLCNDH